MCELVARLEVVRSCGTVLRILDAAYNGLEFDLVWYVATSGLMYPAWNA